MQPIRETRRGRNRRGSVLVEFALIALLLYLILAATLEFGRALFGAQVLQQSTDVLRGRFREHRGCPLLGL